MWELEIQELTSSLVEIFHDLHSHPEPGFQEIRTASFIARYLRELGLEVTEHIALTGVVGVLDSGKPGKTLMLRADMDCLAIEEQSGCEWSSQTKGYMHACGHDAHVTMLLGAAKILSAHKDAFAGKIKFVFQPAEEETPANMKEVCKQAGYLGSGGAGFMVRQGVLEGVDACLALHIQPSIPIGKVLLAKKNACASSDAFHIEILGQGGHGARPHEAIDPVPAASELISAIHMLPSREVSAVETCVFSIGNIETPGSVWNAVANRVIIEGGFRTFNQQTRVNLKKRVREIAQNIAEANRCGVIFEHTDGYMPCINDPDLTAKLASNMAGLLGKDNIIYTDDPAMTSEDFSEYLSRVPGTFFWLGAGKNAESPALHSPKFCVDEASLPIGVRLHVNNAVFVLSVINS